jgi:AAA domain, putative AbiEii toxin, Type IV TA system
LHRIGSVKIGSVGLRAANKTSENHRSPSLPTQFDNLSENFFSLGQGESYYESLNELSEKLKHKIFEGLRDCAANLEIFRAQLEEDVMRESLLRDVRQSNVTGRLNRLTKGDAKLTEFAFTYHLSNAENKPPTAISFSVKPDSIPPTNVHVLIGRNGVGKTRCMRQLALALLGRKNDAELTSSVEMNPSFMGDNAEFSGLILVSFSAFDEFELSPIESDLMRCQQVGLKFPASSAKASKVKSFEDLSRDFADSLERCRSGVLAERWRTAVEALEEDDLFAEADVTSLLNQDEKSELDLKSRAVRIFKKLSSGHAIILLTVTRLVELVDERTLVLLDEPEGHLHPPLLASFIRCLSDLLIRRNGVAIVATHSPVVLQEVPKNCAWKLRRSGRTAIAERPTIETFGENIGVLTREVFGLQVTHSGFHRLLQNAISDGCQYETAIAKFNGNLGDEAKAIIQALISNRDEDIDA